MDSQDSSGGARRPKGQELENRTKRFAVRTILLVASLPSSGPPGVIGGQLLRAATSVGANHRSARRSRSKREFIARIGVVLEEADEAAYWLELLQAVGGLSDLEIRALREEACELVAIFSASLITARANLRVGEPGGR